MLGHRVDNFMELLRCSCRRHLLFPSGQLRCALSPARHTHCIPARQLMGRPQPHVEEGTEGAATTEDRGIEKPSPPHTSHSPLSPPRRTEVSDDTAIREQYGSHGDRPHPKDEWTELKLSLKQLPLAYLSLSKHRITALVSLTAIMGYSLAPSPFHLSTLLCVTAGTALCSAGANAFNQWIEIPYDSQMARTRNRVLVKGVISPLHAVAFGVTTGMAGTALLWHTVNPLTAVLGLSNIVLYAACYTPLKRISISNTWVGALVGFIPPLMGWTACTGTLDPGAFVLGGILFAWQFPHFNALSWRLRGDYSRAGYRMMSVLNPGLCKRTALRYSLALTPICGLAPLLDITTWWFLLDSLPVNAWLTYLSWRFYRDSDFKSARKLFHFTLFHLPLLTGLLLINKKHWQSEDKTATLTLSQE